MEAFVVEGGVALRGEARVDSAKNAVLPILAAAVLTPEEIVLHNVPDITDVGHMAAIFTILLWGTTCWAAGWSVRAGT